MDTTEDQTEIRPDDPAQVCERLRLAFDVAVPALSGDPSRPDAETLRTIDDADATIRRLQAENARLAAAHDAVRDLSWRWESEMPTCGKQIIEELRDTL